MPATRAAVLTSLEPNEVLFLDEIHRMARPAEEMLYMAMEDFRVDVVVGKGPGATAIPLVRAVHARRGHDPGAGCCPAAARPLRLHRPHGLLRPGRPAAHRGTLGAAAGRAADGRCGCRSRREVARDARIANRLLRRMRDYAEVHSDGRVDLGVAQAALELYDVDELGLDRLDKAVMTALLTRFGGGPVGLNTLSVAVAEESETVETVSEPFLVRQGLLVRTRAAGWPPPQPGRISG